MAQWSMKLASHTPINSVRFRELTRLIPMRWDDALVGEYTVSLLVLAGFFCRSALRRCLSKSTMLSSVRSSDCSFRSSQLNRHVLTDPGVFLSICSSMHPFPARCLRIVGLGDCSVFFLTRESDHSLMIWIHFSRKFRLGWVIGVIVCEYAIANSLVSTNFCGKFEKKLLHNQAA